MFMHVHDASGSSWGVLLAASIIYETSGCLLLEIHTRIDLEESASVAQWH